MRRVEELKVSSEVGRCPSAGTYMPMGRLNLSIYEWKIVTY
jgi:hypothetical protein